MTFFHIMEVVMSINPIFSLSGVGYLHEVFRKNDEVFAKINVIHHFTDGAKHSDDVWILCNIKGDDLLQRMVVLENNLRKQKAIILHFSIQYLGFDFCQNGITEEDPNHIVFLAGKLQRIEKCYINGVFLDDQHITPQQVVHS